MSKTTQNYVRQPAATLLKGHRDQAQEQAFQALIGLIGKHLPGMQPDLQKLIQERAQIHAQFDESENQMILQGHGEKGVLRSQTIKSAKDEAEFKALAPARAETPVDVNEVLNLLNQYMTLQLAEQGQQAMVLPTAEMFGPTFHDISADPNIDLMQVKDGVYLVKSEQYAFYTIRIGLDARTVLLLSSNNGPTLATYSQYEERWVQHRNWALADGEVAIKAIEKFFSKANVHAPSKNEIKRLAEQLGRMTQDAGQAKAAEELLTWEDTPDGRVFELKLSDVFTMNIDKSGSFNATATRKDINWDDLTQYTQRQLFEGFQKRLVAVSQAANPTKAAKKAVTKKRR